MRVPFPAAMITAVNVSAMGGQRTAGPGPRAYPGEVSGGSSSQQDAGFWSRKRGCKSLPPSLVSADRRRPAAEGVAAFAPTRGLQRADRVCPDHGGRVDLVLHRLAFLWRSRPDQALGAAP